MMTPYTTITLGVDRDVATVTLRRPNKLNALNRTMSHELVDAFGRAAGVRVLIVTGEGRAFSAGADLSEAGADAPLRGGAVEPPVGLQMLDRLASLPIPTIAAIEGYCLGGGLELALCCDLRYAGEGARFGSPEVLRGLLPGGGGTQRLPRLIGPARAKELMFSGEHIDAHTAERWGLLTRVVPTGDALAEARDIAERILKAAPLAILEIKRLVDEGLDQPLAQALELERARHRWLLGTEDVKEGIRAFLERRPPNFQGR